MYSKTIFKTGLDKCFTAHFKLLDNSAKASVNRLDSITELLQQHSWIYTPGICNVTQYSKEVNYSGFPILCHTKMY